MARVVRVGLTAVVVLVMAGALAWLLGLVRMRPTPVGRPGGGASGGGPLPPLVRPRLLVEKTQHRLTLYDGDAVVRTFRAAVGRGAGDKVREGDGCTPEGDFYVCMKNPQSKYTLSLGLSYPTEEDAARGLRDALITQARHDEIVQALRAGGQPPWDTPLGGEIMIHGRGAGRDWTAGCIALDDPDITLLFHALSVGTPVRIVP